MQRRVGFRLLPRVVRRTNAGSALHAASNSGDECERFVERVCRDPVLLEEVVLLLPAPRHCFLRYSRGGTPGHGSDQEQSLIGTRLGAYESGSGRRRGMGRVYRANDAASVGTWPSRSRRFTRSRLSAVAAPTEYLHAPRHRSTTLVIGSSRSSLATRGLLRPLASALQDSDRRPIGRTRQGNRSPRPQARERPGDSQGSPQTG